MVTVSAPRHRPVVLFRGARLLCPSVHNFFRKKDSGFLFFPRFSKVSVGGHAWLPLIAKGLFFVIYPSHKAVCEARSNRL